MYPKDTEKWKQFTTASAALWRLRTLFCIPKILKNESNSQQEYLAFARGKCCFVSQRYWKMKAIHNWFCLWRKFTWVVLYPKDTEKWKQFTTLAEIERKLTLLFCIPKILKNESNSQRFALLVLALLGCFVSQRYWKMKAIHNTESSPVHYFNVVLYPKDTEKWKQFTTKIVSIPNLLMLFCIPKILKNESNSQHSR